ncbi:MAG TPA: hypothetical protein VN922_24135, partial [Bacteroidia bacterium]|nr:hypothetical protein [Bacteroidia bacterium]
CMITTEGLVGNWIQYGLKNSVGNVISPPLMSDDAADDITYTPCTKCVLKKNKINNKQKHIDRERPVQRCVRRLEHEKYLVGITQLVGPLVLLETKC